MIFCDNKVIGILYFENLLSNIFIIECRFMAFVFRFYYVFVIVAMGER